MDITRKPSEKDRLAQALEAIFRIEPDNNDLSRLIFEFRITCRFIVTSIPISMEVIFVRINPGIASSGR